MAWFDIAAGLAQGAQQGIDRVQADQVRRKADAFKDAQEKRALAAEARTASEDRRRQLAEELDRQDPSNIDPAFVGQMTSEERRSLLRPVKGPDGAALYQRRESPGATMERENKALAAKDFAPGLAATVETRTAGLGDLRRQQGAQKLYDDPAWQKTASDRDRWLVGTTLKIDPQETARTLTPPGQAAYRALTSQGISGAYGVTAAGVAQAGADRRAADTLDNRLAISKEQQKRLDSRAASALKIRIAQSLVKADEELRNNYPELQKRVEAEYKMLMDINPGGGGAGLPDDDFSLLSETEGE